MILMLMLMVVLLNVMMVMTVMMVMMDKALSIRLSGWPNSQTHGGK